MLAHYGAVLHVNQSNGNLFNWFNGDHNVSAHFEVYKNGAVEQYLDTAESSWCQMDGNGTYISIETEGYDHEPLTNAQMLSLAKLYAWLHKTHGMPFELADKPGQRGFGWHGMGGVAWGNHPGCPGTLRKAQRAKILTMAQALANPRPPAALRPDPNGYKFTLYTVSGGKGAVYAFAPGHWQRLNTGQAAALMRLREAPRVIVQVLPGTLDYLRAVAIGGNSR
jgi:hypothetical protein